MRKALYPPIALAAAALAACAGDSVVLQSYYNYPAYDYSNFTLYHGGRDTEVDVYGNPFEIEPATFAVAVTDHMQNANIGPSTNFTTTPGPSAERNLWVVMAFNTGMSVYYLCDRKAYSAATNGPTGRGKPASRGILLKAAWCFDGRQESWVEARIEGASGPDDPRFRALVRQTVLNLFVPRERFLERDGRRRRGLHLRF